MTIVRRSENRIAVINEHKGIVIRKHNRNVEVDVHHGNTIIKRFRNASIAQIKSSIEYVK